MKGVNKTGKTKINHRTNCRHTLAIDGSNTNRWNIGGPGNQNLEIIKLIKCAPFTHTSFIFYSILFFFWRGDGHHQLCWC